VGLQRGDWVLELNGKPVLSQQDFARRITEGKPGSEAVLVVWRNGQKSELRVRLDDQASHPQLPIHAVGPEGGSPAGGSVMGDPGQRRLPNAYSRIRPPAPTLAHDYQQRMTSVESLLAALQRIAVEKGNPAQAEETTRRVMELLQLAREDFSRYRLNEGRVNLEKAYATVTQAVQGVRQGETLVHALNFSSKREEFLYELDRYETFRILKDDTVALTPKKAEEAGVRTLLQQAENKYAEAGRQADGGEFANAVRLIEAANDALVQALRLMGMDIPG
jgi:hypothetical protein